MLEGGLAALDAVAREATLFAAIWFIAGGIDDLLVDLIYGLRRLHTRAQPEPCAPSATASGRFAIFVPAWDESAVIGAMLRTALARFEHPGYRIYVGAYPNDPMTIDAIVAVADADARVRLVIGPAPGPTTKADCLNAIWHALRRDEAAGDAAAFAIVLHDAEDLVHADELQVFARFLERYEAVQLPIMPLPHPQSPLVSGHYADEFAEAHGKSLIVRQAIGAALPLAGTGCAIRRDMIDRVAAARNGQPFDAASLTEDYELGLTIHALGGRTLLARVPDRDGEGPVAVRAYFPSELRAAVRQKARWLTGIALVGWDRTGWGRAGDLGEHWMRMRDRRATLAMPVLAIAYFALIVWGLAFAGHFVLDTAPPLPASWIVTLLWTNLGLFVWRLAVRASFVGRAYGWRQACWSLPRVFVGNAVALLAARRAVMLYARMLVGAPPRWEKTEHQFPESIEQPAR